MDEVINTAYLFLMAHVSEHRINILSSKLKQEN